MGLTPDINQSSWRFVLQTRAYGARDFEEAVDKSILLVIMTDSINSHLVVFDLSAVEVSLYYTYSLDGLNWFFSKKIISVFPLVAWNFLVTQNS